MARHGPLRPTSMSLVLPALLVVSLLPARWLTPWTGRAGELMGLPLVPLGDGFSAVRSWLEDGPPESRNSPENEELWSQLKDYRRELVAARNTINTLREQLAVFERSRSFLPEDVNIRPVQARVVRVTTTRSGQPLLVVNKGARLGVTTGAVAIHNDDVAAGYVLGEPQGTTATIRPLAAEETGVIRGLLADAEGLAEGELLPLLLRPQGDRWIAELPRARWAGMSEGTTVRLADERWPWAQGYRVGIVGGVRAVDATPTLVELEITPLAPASELRNLVLLCEQEPSP